MNKQVHTQIKNGTVCVKTDSCSTGRFSRGIEQEQLLNHSPEDEDTNSELRALKPGKEKQKQKNKIRANEGTTQLSSAFHQIGSVSSQLQARGKLQININKCCGFLTKA